MANFNVLDAFGSVITIESSTIGSANRQVVTTTIPGTVNVSVVGGVVGTSIVGQLPAGTAVLGSIAALQGTNPWAVSGSVFAMTSILGQLPAGVQVLGSVAALQGTNPWEISGSVVSYVKAGSITAISGNTSVMLLNGANVIGSVATLQGTSPWLISSVYGNISGSVVAFPGTGAGSVQAVQSGTRITSIVNSIPSSVLVGNYSHRNDALASFLGGDTTWNPVVSDSAGRLLVKPFVSEDGTIFRYVSSLTSTSVTIVKASAIGKRNYITDLFLSNTGATTTRVTFKDGSTSLVGEYIAPTGGGYSAPGLSIPLVGAVSQDLTVVAGSNTSMLLLTVIGYQAP